MISIESLELERMNYCRGTPVVVSAGPLHQAGAAENKDVIHGPADNLQRDTWGRQPLGSGEGDGSFVPTLHRGTRGRGGLLTVGLFTTGQFLRKCSRPAESKATVSSNHSIVFCSTADVIG